MLKFPILKLVKTISPVEGSIEAGILFASISVSGVGESYEYPVSNGTGIGFVGGS